MVVIAAKDTLTALGMEVEVYFDLKNVSFVLNTHQAHDFLSADTAQSFITQFLADRYDAKFSVVKVNTMRTADANESQALPKQLGGFGAPNQNRG